MIHGEDEPTISIGSADPEQGDFLDLGMADEMPYALLWVHNPDEFEYAGILLGPEELRALSRKALSLATELEERL